MTLNGTVTSGNTANTDPSGTGTINDDDDARPDYIPELDVLGTHIDGPSSQLNIIVNIGEFDNGINFNGDLMFTIVKNNNFELTFDENEMLRRNQVMQNSFWELTQTDSLYIFTYTGNNGMFPSMQGSKIGLGATFTSPDSRRGHFTLDVTIVGGTGEVEFNNNADTHVIEYDNLDS